jgi:hypothetical protein
MESETNRLSLHGKLNVVGLLVLLWMSIALMFQKREEFFPKLTEFLRGSTENSTYLKGTSDENCIRERRRSCVGNYKNAPEIYGYGGGGGGGVKLEQFQVLQISYGEGFNCIGSNLKSNCYEYWGSGSPGKDGASSFVRGNTCDGDYQEEKE